jgi:glutathione S-transferase
LLETPQDYVIYGGPISLFTRKLESAMRFYAAPHSMKSKQPGNGEEVEGRSGTHQVPVLHTPEGWMLGDTTPLLDLLDARFPRRRLFPEGPLGVLVHVVEEVLDEWFARTMVHYRWHHEENTRHVVEAILGRSVSLEEAREFPLAKWGPRACRATGTESEHQQREVEREYLAMLDALEHQLGNTRYALGDRPTAVDAILLGGLRGHTNADPVPDLSGYVRVVAWDEERADEWKGDGELARFPDSTPFAEHVLAVGRECYADFVLGNARALEKGAKAFSIETYGEEVSYLARPYPERSRRMIQARIRDRLDESNRQLVLDWLERVELARCFAP